MQLPTTSSLLRAALLLTIGLLLQACVVVPKTTETYDHECQIVRKKMELQPVQIGAFVGCVNDGCIAALVFVGATAAASAVVSGSVALVGNFVYWMEERGRCVKPAP